jgi:hypothetical protein
LTTKTLTVDVLVVDRVADGLSEIGAQLKRLNDNIENGYINLRTHHPLCAAPLGGDYTVQQLDVMSRFLNDAIKTGALVLPTPEVKS